MLRPTRIALTARVMLVPYLVVLFWIIFAPAEDAGRVTGVVAWIAELLVGIGIPFELVQLALPSRFSTVSDVVANTLGTGLGLLLIAVASESVARRR